MLMNLINCYREEKKRVGFGSDKFIQIRDEPESSFENQKIWNKFFLIMLYVRLNINTKIPG